MKRNTKNIVMILLVIIMTISMFLTINYIKNNSVSNNIVDNQIGGTPPDMNNSNVGTPPSKPGESSYTNNNENNTSEESNNNQNMSEPPEKPSGDNSNNQGSPMMNNNSDNDNSSSNTIYYILLGGEALVTSFLVIYLLMSKFNKKNFNETFSESDKVIIYILSGIILTSLITYTDIKLTENTNNTSNQSENMSGSTQNTNITYSGKKEITTDENITKGEYESTSSDENVIIATGKITSNISNVTVIKTGDSDGEDNTSFYGTNSAILAKDGATLNIKNATIKTDATGANGVFSYGGSANTNNSTSDGTTINISDSKITTTKDNSGGIMTTGGGVMNATNLTIDTSGTSSAAIRSDRGGGDVIVKKGTYTTTGQGSPSIYSTANIKVSDATLISKASEGVVIEGANSVTLNNVTLTDTNNKLNGQSTTYKNIFLYQSMSGDADNGNATFTSKDSTITTNKGDTFYVTNTTATINLENNTIKNNDNTGNFLRIQKDSWGKSGSNGGDVTLNMTKQTANGNIVVDSISTLTMNMSKSIFEGSINTDNTASNITLKLDKNSKIKLTSDSYVTSLDDADSSYSNIDFNGYKLYVNGTAIN